MNSLQTKCENCHRQGVLTEAISWLEVRYKTRKLYCSFRSQGQLEVNLCSCCKQYLLSSTSNNGGVTIYWPAMVWAFLSCQPQHPRMASKSLLDKWAIIVSEWRLWWVHELSTLEPRITLDFPPCLFHNATKNRNKVKIILENLEWKSLSLMMDKYLTYPTVRCPWGDGVFLTETNQLPFGDFLSSYSNYILPNYNKHYKD